jgi:hypothetical protein
LTIYSSCFGFFVYLFHVLLGINSMLLLAEISWPGDFEL